MATLSLELSLYQEREREREREIVETITGAGDDLLFFKIMQICYAKLQELLAVH